MNKENFLDVKPRRKKGLMWYRDKRGYVTLKKINNGICNTLCRIVLKKPKISYIHLDQTGSYIWLASNGENSIYEIGKFLKNKFGDEITPVYERLIKYFTLLKAYKFIDW